MIKATFQQALRQVGAIGAGILLLMVSAAVLSFGFMLSLVLLVVGALWGLIGSQRRDARRTSDDVIDLSRADYQEVHR